jgi:hypothetical protein
LSPGTPPRHCPRKAAETRLTSEEGAGPSPGCPISHLHQRAAEGGGEGRKRAIAGGVAPSGASALHRPVTRSPRPKKNGGTGCWARFLRVDGVIRCVRHPATCVDGGKPQVAAYAPDLCTAGEAAHRLTDSRSCGKCCVFHATAPNKLIFAKQHLSGFYQIRSTAPRKPTRGSRSFRAHDRLPTSIPAPSPRRRGESLAGGAGQQCVRIRGRPPCAGERGSAEWLRLIRVGDRTALCLEIGLPRGMR